MDWLRIFLARFVIVPSSNDLILKWAEVMVAGQAFKFLASSVDNIQEELIPSQR